MADGIVQTDKIGTSNYFWAFPSMSLQQNQLRRRNLQEAVASKEKKVTELEGLVKTAAESRSNPQRAELLQKFASLRDEKRDLDRQVLVFDLAAGRTDR